jgi:exodeoxyribonuclease III
MRIITFNCNGIRSAGRKGFLDWLAGQDADVVCLQELRADVAQVEAAGLVPAGWHCLFEPARRPGYSGVALWSKQAPEAVTRGFGAAEFDAEGRYLSARIQGITVASIYLPSGSASEARQQSKFRFLECFAPHLDDLRSQGAHVLCGDWNIAHRQIDLRNWRGNQKNSGFLPEERAWLDGVFAPGCWSDAFREVDDRPDQYTWWSNRGQARAKNVGWRIDYQIVSPDLRGRARRAIIHPEPRLSDHAPLIMDYDFG